MRLCSPLAGWVTAFLLLATAPVAGAQPSGHARPATVPVHAEVHAGMELVAVALWIAGKYPPPSDSRYKGAVWTHFRRYRHHPTLARLKRLNVYPDLTEVGLVLGGAPSGAFVLPDSMSWYRIYGRDTTAALLADLRAFGRASGFGRFYEQHRADYAAWASAFRRDLETQAALEAPEMFFRYEATRPRPAVTIYLEPLNGWGAHAIDFQRLMGVPNGARVTFQLGPSGGEEELPDSPVVFRGSSSTVSTVWHEAAHIYLRPLLDGSGAAIDTLARLFDAPALAAQNVRTWRYAFEENLVRAVTAVLIQQARGEEAYRREVRTQEQRGFVFTYELAEWLRQHYASDALRYPTFDAAFPDLLAVLSAHRSARDARRPE